MVDLVSAAAAVRSLKDASDMVGKALAANPRDSGPITELLITARLTLLEMIERNALLQDDVATLRQQVTTLEREKRELLEFGEGSEKYERIAVAGKFVYREKLPAGSNAEVPYLCPTCFAEKKARILQISHSQLYQCHSCKWMLNLGRG